MPQHPGNDLTQSMTELATGLLDYAKSQRGKDLPLPIENEDGTPNYINILELLRGPNFEEYRQQNPEIVRQARANLGVDLFTRLAQGAINIGKLGFSLSQIRKAKQIDDTPPAFPKRPQRNINLRRAIADASREAAEGLSASERELLRGQGKRRTEAARRALINASGGSSSAVQAGIQALAAQEGQQNLREAALNAQTKGQASSRLANLIAQQGVEDRSLSRFDQSRFNRRDFPLFNMRSRAKERLLGAGLSNAFNAGDALFSNAASLGRVFGGDLPGTVFPNSSFEGQDGSHPLDGVFLNPAKRMVTGQKLFESGGTGLGGRNINPPGLTDEQLQIIFGQ